LDTLRKQRKFCCGFREWAKVSELKCQFEKLRAIASARFGIGGVELLEIRHRCVLVTAARSALLDATPLLEKEGDISNLGIAP